MNRKLLCIMIGFGISFLSGCGAGQEARPKMAESTTEGTEPADIMEAAEVKEHAGDAEKADAWAGMPEEQRALFQQELLFLQQGFRQHNIQNSYTVYFALPEEWNDQFFQEMLLEGKEGLWRESFTYTYDSDRDWYTFSGEFEPVLTNDESCLEKDDESAEEFRAESVYQAELSAETDIAVPLRFDIPSGPLVYDQPRMDDNWENYLDTYIYVYQDERLDVTVEIEYPQYSRYTPEIEDVEAVNECIREFFFYGYGSDREAWRPEQEMYGSIYRSYEITRKDDRYLSVCIYEYNFFRGANHPNDWKSGMTIDLTTGQALTLRDVTGTDRAVEDLIGTGAFHCLQIWADGPMSPEETEEADRLQVEEACQSVDLDLTDDFYLTPDKLGLIGGVGRYYVCMEAPYAEIGLAEWAAALEKKTGQ